MREADRHVIEDLGVSGTALMTSAAEHIAKAAIERIPLGGRAAIFCGTGNNGGDGIGAAALLLEKGIPARVFLIGSEDKLTRDSKEMLKRLNASGGALECFSGADADACEIEEYSCRCDVIIDAIFGIGLNSELRGDALSAVKMINASRACVIAADIPSGVHADTGAVLGDAVTADITVTFSMAKPGHFIEPGCTKIGELRVCDIGIPQGVTDSVKSDVFAVAGEDVRLPRRRADSHKGDYGRCLIIAGSKGYTGAPALCARAASRMGAGLVFLGVPESIYDIEAIKLDEEMPFPLPCDADGRLNADARVEILRRAEECGVCLIGPGLGRSAEITDLVNTVIRTVKTPVVLDADAINAIAGNADILDQASNPVILTPHTGEFMRLTGGMPPEDRLRAARDFSRLHGCILVLKGHRTISAFPDGAAYINTTGNPAMAKGGSGDVLAGMIAALIGQNIPVKDAVTTAVYLHGLAGDMCAAEYGEYSVTAGDITAMLPRAARTVNSE
jgi:NAD(P)H-hydrate epimerase